MPYKLHFTLFETDQGRSIEEFLQWAFPRQLEDELVHWLTSGRVSSGGQPVSPGGLCMPGELAVSLPDHIEDPVNHDWQVIWETHDLMAVYKPAPLPVSRTTKNLFGTLISEIRRHTPWRDARLLHRLDTETSGLILIAKYEAADKRWKKRFERLLVRKLYHAWVWGNPAQDTYEITWPLSEKQGSAIRSQMYVADSRSGEYLNPKSCHTRVRVLERHSEYSLVECELLTGRRHQIRAHLAALGHPIVGDKIYSHAGRYYLQRLERPLDDGDITALGSSRQLLQAQSLGLELRGEQLMLTLPASLDLPRPETE